MEYSSIFHSKGLKTASMMWIGTDIITRTPDIWLPYDDSYPFEYRINDVVNYISKLKIDLTFLYFEEPVSYLLKYNFISFK